jgi:multiple sugar transport system substrate-binding protein
MNVSISRGKAKGKTLKILQWKHFVPAYDRWFNDILAKGWAEKNDVEVTVDNMGWGDVSRQGAAELKVQRGHDLVQFLTPMTAYEDNVIDHRDIYEECQHRYGRFADFVTKSTYNPRTGKYFGFCATYQPAVITYRKHLWDAVQLAPTSWDNILVGGRRIKLLYGSPVGFSLNAEQNSEQTMRAIMYSFGSSEQDEGGNPNLKSKQTLEVLKYVKSVYQETMIKDVLSWEAPSNNQFMLSGEGSLTLDTISIPRASETLRLPFADDLRLAKTPEGSVAQLNPTFGFHTYFIWNFAENVGDAKQFLVDFVGHLRDAFVASGFQNMPALPDAVPDIPGLAAKDPVATPPDKYALLAGAPSWTTNIGHPASTNAAIYDVYERGVIPRMCAQAATGLLTPEQALDQADAQVRQIFQKWKEKGKI